MPAMAAARASAKLSVLKSPDGKMVAIPFFSLSSLSFCHQCWIYLVPSSFSCRCCTPPPCGYVSGSVCGWQGTSSMSCRSTAWCHPICQVNWQKEGSSCPFPLFWNSARSWAWTLLNCWNFSWLAAVGQPWPRSVPPESCRKASTPLVEQGCVLGLHFVEEGF